jgi:thiamine biosynthesis lipoprotein
LKKSSLIYLAVGIILAGFVLYMVRAEKKIERTEFLMDTIVNSVIYTRNRRQGVNALSSAFGEMYRLEIILDRHHTDSEVFVLNRDAGTRPIVVSAEALDVIKKSLQVGEQTGGAFDITIAPLINLWRFGSADVYVPSENELAQTVKLVDFRRVQVNNNDGTVFLDGGGTELDLGGIAKGYIVDMAIEALLEQGITSAYLDAGGDIRVIGEKPDGSAWRIGVRHPRDRRGIIAIVELRDKAIVTSGDYERFFVVDDVRYHHIIDPKTGEPSRGIISVTVIAPDAFTADAYSTALFVLGLEKGMEIIESLPELEAIMITEDEQVHITSGLAGKVEIRQ